MHLVTGSGVLVIALLGVRTQLFSLDAFGTVEVESEPDEFELVSAKVVAL